MAKKTQDVKGKTQDELHKLLLDTRKEQFNLRFQRTGGQLEKTHEIRKARRTVARIKTQLAALRGEADGKPVAKKASAPKTTTKAKAEKPAKAKKTAT